MLVGRLQIEIGRPAQLRVAPQDRRVAEKAGKRSGKDDDKSEDWPSGLTVFDFDTLAAASSEEQPVDGTGAHVVMTPRQQKNQRSQPQPIQNPNEIPRRALDPARVDGT